MEQTGIVESAKRDASIGGEAGRVCKLPSCKSTFVYRRVDQTFCSPEHRIEYHRQVVQNGVKALERGKMHAARIGNSTRLQKLYAFLSEGRPHTTKEIGDATGIEAVGSAVGELRRNGFNIVCRCRRSEGDARVYEYQLTGN